MRGFTVKHLIILAAIVLIVFGIVFTATSRSKEGFELNDTMQEDDTLKPGEGITSANGLYKLVFGVDGSLKIVNLDIKSSANPSLKTIKDFKIDTSKTDTLLTFRRGNLAIVIPGNKDEVVWETKTSGSGSKIQIQDNGNLAITTDKNVVSWSSNPKKEGFAQININNATTDASFNIIRDNEAELKNGLVELDRLGDPNTNVSKLQMDTTVYISVFWTVVASSMIYFFAINM